MPRRGRDVEVIVDVSLRDVLYGVTRDIKVPAADGKMKTVTVKARVRTLMWSLVQSE